ncbi:hypothetical protein OS493_002032 [Desmophyllum pertusum]|uniref:Uncharacterized protein n=1 Tax=Desmophyllum pertusum TaxID=174260 RepID=A0A9X0CVV4_9CNID|nr:hypothetical protein OS493_002032 [Desmophyllum pertusum]
METDHLRRTFLRILKYQTRELTFYKDKHGSTIATINHLCQLRETYSKRGEDVPFTANDLIIISFFDQHTAVLITGPDFVYAIASTLYHPFWCQSAFPLHIGGPLAAVVSANLQPMTAHAVAHDVVQQAH